MMKSRGEVGRLFPLVGLLGLLLIGLTGIDGCAPLRRTVNVSEQANLAQVSRLEIGELAVEPEMHYEHRLTVTDPSILRRLTAALDADLPLVPLLDCPAEYRLSFMLATDEMQEMGYYCKEGPSFLNGAQDFWSGRQVEPPAEFDAAMSDLLETLPE
jgi:hypothetical protein